MRLALRNPCSRKELPGRSARAITAGGSGGSWIEDGDFVRLREVSSTWRMRWELRGWSAHVLPA